MTDKLRDYFDEMVVYKDLKNNNFFSSLGLPAFLRDYLLKMFSDDFGNFDVDEVSAFVKKFIPKKEDWMSIKNKIIYENESVQILTKISVDINIKTGEISFAIPDFGVTEKETLIEPAIWDVYKEDLINTGETWGIIKLGYRQPDDTVKPKIPGKIKLTGFKNFRPYTVDVEYFKEMRSNFETDEWIDILLGAIDYNADGYETKLQKLTMLTRLLPFVEKRINLIELAPKGTGKSYVFGHISKNGLLTDGGKVTRSKMFYDANRRKPGWSHHQILMSKVSNREEYIWYLEKTLEHKWSVDDLTSQVKSQLYERQAVANKISNFERRLPAEQKDMVVSTMKDPYMFDFINYTEEMLETDIENELVKNVTSLLMELGTGFAFMGQQYHLEVGGKDFYIDLLFYNTKLRCYVAIDLKTGEFKPEQAGKMNFYLSALDDLVKAPEDNPSVGLILCRDENRTIAEYALRDMSKPIGVSEYHLCTDLPLDLKNALPAVEDIRSRIDMKK